MNETDYTLSVISNAQYANYYSNMQLAETDNMAESDSMSAVDLYHTYKGMFEANHALHMGAGSIMASLSTLGMMTQGTGQGVQLLHDAMAASMIAMGINSAIRAAMNARASWEATQAAIEAAAAAIAQNWVGLAIAGATAAMVFETFSVINHPAITVNADISTPLGIQQVSQTMGAVANG